MADLYEQWLEKAEGRKGSFITNEEGRVVFIGGPGAGGGGSGGSGSTSGGLRPGQQTTGVSFESRIIKGKDAVNAPELEMNWDYYPGVGGRTDLYGIVINDSSGNPLAVASVDKSKIVPVTYSATYVYGKQEDSPLPKYNVHLGDFASPVDAMRAIEIGLAKDVLKQ